MGSQRHLIGVLLGDKESSGNLGHLGKMGGGARLDNPGKDGKVRTLEKEGNHLGVGGEAEALSWMFPLHPGREVVP